MIYDGTQSAFSEVKVTDFRFKSGDRTFKSRTDKCSGKNVGFFRIQSAKSLSASIDTKFDMKISLTS